MSDTNESQFLDRDFAIETVKVQCQGINGKLSRLLNDFMKMTSQVTQVNTRGTLFSHVSESTQNASVENTSRPTNASSPS